MRYWIHFEAELPADALRRFLLTEYGVAPESVYVGRVEDRAVDDPRPVAMLTPPDADEGFGWILTGDTELAAATDHGERDLAVTLAREFGVRALVDDGGIHPDRWVLVSVDGSSGRVLTDEDAAADGDLRIVHALEPISGEPQLAVVPPPDWARDW
ncbi:MULTISPECIES: hypothetical protein [unclassified Micromonospora]|uniref:hypothetical protein n=1 Tax=unclassified Micromonospora TaxID=2617518 RepID=UPI0003EEC23D|nr:MULTISPECIES: hypothetical protein [unclassified Micromonospora]EWM63802.1 hypothetical protein MCBG_00935 [Micromonospora sp. M42]MCK1807012.1 hypothetical protein [Micromonospora sp. R42106]MCK1831708.1 hypothetical protein [Micromonospora sp. R42003]MCK1842608.1 hypothetical protein [Micromonospora sp. R42004]MCM1014988.1 hypothetical protein [Micromonospora sp. XM-20-01]